MVVDKRILSAEWSHGPIIKNTFLICDFSDTLLSGMQNFCIEETKVIQLIDEYSDKVAGYA